MAASAKALAGGGVALVFPEAAVAALVIMDAGADGMNAFGGGPDAGEALLLATGVLAKLPVAVVGVFLLDRDVGV